MIYLDQDGVLADFNARLADYGVSPNWDAFHRPKSTWTKEERAHDDKVVECMGKPDFWSGIPVMDGAYDLVEAAIGLNEGVTILTARPNNPEWAERVRSQKSTWIDDKIKTKFPEANIGFICCLRSEKVLYATDAHAESHILVDDLAVNIDEWTKAGGLGVRYVNAPQAIKDLKKIA